VSPVHSHAATQSPYRTLLAHAGHTCSGSGGLPENPRPRPSGSALGTNVTPHKAVTVPSVGRSTPQCVS
ncbi:MAG: hypothetical protein ACRDS0_39350, partial [Pseudonocardiaceae bacterium]